MMSPPEARDRVGVEQPAAGDDRRGNRRVVIERYRVWSALRRGVSDVRGARDAFVTLGFKVFRSPPFERASGLRALGSSGDDFLSRRMRPCRPPGRDSSSAAGREK